MADKLIITKDGILEVNFTEEEKQAIEQQKAIEQVKYNVAEKTPSQTEIDFAEYVLATEDRITELESQINKLNGGTV